MVNKDTNDWTKEEKVHRSLKAKTRMTTAFSLDDFSRVSHAGL